MSHRKGASAPRLRRVLAAGTVILLMAAGILVSLQALNKLGKGGGRPTTKPTQAAPEPVPVLDFQPAPGWHVRTTDPTIARRVGVQAWAANLPFARDEETPIGPINSFPDGWPDRTEKELPPDGIILVANYGIQTRNPLPPGHWIPERTLPLTIDSPPSVEYEGQDPDRALAVINATVNGRDVSVRIVFGTGDPGPALIRTAEEQLARLIVAPPTTTVADLDDFGIRMQVPDPWHRILFRWPVGEPTLHAATVPITDLYDGSSARRELGRDDLFLVLSENYAASVHYQPVTPPIAIGREDICPTCEIMDNGTAPPQGHTLFYRSFAVGERQFDLFVEFGTPNVSDDQLGELNAVLASLQIDPGDTRPWAGISPSQPTEASAPVPLVPIRVNLPAGWIQKNDPVPGSDAPRIVAGFATWDFPTGGVCGPEPALADLPNDGALVWVLEYVDPANRGDYDNVISPRFSIDLQYPPARWDCAASAPSRMYQFRNAGRYFDFYVALGPRSTEETVKEVNNLIRGFKAEPRA